MGDRTPLHESGRAWTTRRFRIDIDEEVIPYEDLPEARREAGPVLHSAEAGLTQPQVRLAAIPRGALGDQGPPPNNRASVTRMEN